MKIRVDSVEYRCWHEVGHATVCLHLGGDVDFIELLADDARGHARARCVVTSKIEKSVACGGFAAEFHLLNNGYAERGRDDERDISRIVFHNATHDREDFWGRKLGSNEVFTETEDREFMHHAIGSDGHGGMVPIFVKHFSGMQDLVGELCDARRVEGRRVKDLLRINIRVYLDNVVVSALVRGDLTPAEMDAVNRIEAAHAAGRLKRVTSKESHREQARTASVTTRTELEAAQSQVSVVPTDYAAFESPRAQSASLAGRPEDKLFQILRSLGLKDADAKHLVNAVSDCQYFVTTDPHFLDRCELLERACKSIHILRPSELVAVLLL